MEVNRTDIEVRYQETDQMGVVYHANYLVWFEIGRTKYIEQLGFKYIDLEKQGLVSPVVDAKIHYHFPIKYGDKVSIETWLAKYDGIRTTYGYRVLNEEGKEAVTGETEHVVVKQDTFKPVIIRKHHKVWHEAYLAQVKKEQA